jgi:hypothetical protein
VDELHTSDEGANNVNPPVRNLVTTRVMYLLDFFYDRNDPHKISKQIFFYDHYLQIQQKCIILADGFIVLELSSLALNILQLKLSSLS